MEEKNNIIIYQLEDGKTKIKKIFIASRSY